MAKRDNQNAPSLASFGQVSAFSGECLFKITDPNARYLAAYVKYVQVLEVIAGKKDDDVQIANIDGVLNSLLAEALESRLKRIARKRSLKLEELVLILSEEVNTAGALLSLQEAEKMIRVAELQEVMDHVPIEDLQGRLTLE